MRRVILIVALVIAAGCGSTPAAPTPTPSYLPLAGVWTGTATEADGHYIAVSVTLQQTAGSLVGTWTQTNSATGNHGTVTATLAGQGATTATGTLTLDVATDQPNTRCAGHSTLTGTANATALQWDTPSMTTATADGQACEGTVPAFHWALSR